MKGAFGFSRLGEGGDKVRGNKQPARYKINNNIPIPIPRCERRSGRQYQRKWINMINRNEEKFNSVLVLAHVPGRGGRNVWCDPKEILRSFVVNKKFMRFFFCSLVCHNFSWMTGGGFPPPSERLLFSFSRISPLGANKFNQILPITITQPNAAFSSNSLECAVRDSKNSDVLLLLRCPPFWGAN